MPPRTNPANPFHSARLIYRSVRTPEDNALFTAINNDAFGYQNSNGGNYRLPGQADAEKFQKYVAECMLGAVICLPKVPEKDAKSEKKEDGADGEEGKEGELEKDAEEEFAEAGTPIGQLQLSGLSPNMKHHRSAEIGIDILPAYQGKGYGSEVINWALDQAFRRIGLHRVDIRVFEWNDGALKLYKKLGFVEEGRKRQALWHEGRWWDGVELGMLEGEWWEAERRRKEKVGKLEGKVEGKVEG